MKRLMIAALIILSGVAHAEEFCDATKVATLTTYTLYYAEKYAAGLSTQGNRTPVCRATEDLARGQYQAALELGAKGCRGYYNGPSRAQLVRMGELSNIFKAYRP